MLGGGGGLDTGGICACVWGGECGGGGGGTHETAFKGVGGVGGEGDGRN